jgi:peptidoglycan/LPS O-acetylase OafA/YrhL
MRNKTIDFLRAVALITIVLIHSLVPYLHDPLSHQLWNASQFAVQIFVFCSGYLFFAREFDKEEKVDMTYIIKRLKRLLVPYYIYMLIFIPILFFTHRSSVSLSYIVSSVLLTGGIDIGWLVLLFIEFIFILLFLKYSLKNNNYLFFILFFISFLSSVIFLITKSPLDYRLIMWLPWALVLIYAYYFKLYETAPQKLFKVSIGTLAMFIVSFVYVKTTHRSTVFFDNKYPPNIFYLTYGLLFIPFLYTIGTKIKNNPFIDFFSRYSYSLFFIHYLVIYILTFLQLPRYLPALVFFFIVLSISAGIQLCFNKVSTS